MTKSIDELSRELAVAAAAEGKSVSVLLRPIAMDFEGDGNGFAAAALTAAMSALMQPSKVRGALSLDDVCLCKCHKSEPEEGAAESPSMAQ